MENLQKQFDFVSVTQIVRLNRKFYAASMKEGTDLQEHLTYMTSLAEQLQEMKEEISLKILPRLCWEVYPSRSIIS